MLQVAEAMEACGWTPTVVLSGTAHGVDKLGEQWAGLRGIPVERYPAKWYVDPQSPIDRSAGRKRNVLMAEKAHALVAVWDGQSSGTHHMISVAREKGLRVYVYEPYKGMWY